MALVVGGLAGRFLSDPGAAPVPAPVAAPAAPADQVAVLEARVGTEGDDGRAWQQLGVAYLLRGIQTADPSFAALASQALDRAASLLGDDDVPTLVGQGALAITLHDFRSALRIATDANRADPFDGDALAVLVDANVELGRYDDAERHLQDLLDLRPGLAAYSRLAYLRELHGDVDGARVALVQAETAGAGASFDVAVVAALRGDLALRTGDLAGAESAYLDALDRSPDLPAAELGLSRVAAARGDIDGAVAALEELTARVPLPAAIVLLAELHDLRGDATAAAAGYDLVRDVWRLQAAAGANTDLEAAVFEADHGSPDEAVRLARAAVADQPTVGAADALAWALHQAGRHAEAVDAVDDALRLGTADPVLHAHAAVVLAGAGEEERAAGELRAAYELSPHLTPWLAPRVADLAAELGVAVPAGARP